MIGASLEIRNHFKPLPRASLDLIDLRPSKVYQVPLVHAFVLLAHLGTLWRTYDVHRAEIVVEYVGGGHVVQDLMDIVPTIIEMQNVRKKLPRQ